MDPWEQTLVAIGSSLLRIEDRYSRAELGSNLGYRYLVGLALDWDHNSAVGDPRDPRRQIAEMGVPLEAEGGSLRLMH